jgi:hypothetical protein
MVRALPLPSKLLLAVEVPPMLKSLQLVGLGLLQRVPMRGFGFKQSVVVLVETQGRQKRLAPLWEAELVKVVTITPSSLPALCWGARKLSLLVPGVLVLPDRLLKRAGIIMVLLVVFQILGLLQFGSFQPPVLVMAVVVVVMPALVKVVLFQNVVAEEEAAEVGKRREEMRALVVRVVQLEKWLPPPLLAQQEA